MKFTPMIVGRGAAGKAMQKSIVLAQLSDPELEIAPAIMLPRGTELAKVAAFSINPILLIANPHALHAPLICEAIKSGFKAVITDKPVCISREQWKMLSTLNTVTPIHVCHGYRQTWAIQTMRDEIRNGKFGELISIEGHYRQCSAAQRAVEGKKNPEQWKNEPGLSGNADTLIDLGTHWLDAVLFLMGEKPVEHSCWISYLNAEFPHRDTHVQFHLKFADGTLSQGAVSKTFHGAANDFTLSVVGTKKQTTWRLSQPDLLEVGEGNKLTWLQRPSQYLTGSEQNPFHGLGWLEGYLEIIRQTFRKCAGMESKPVPTLTEALAVMDTLLEMQELKS